MSSIILNRPQIHRSAEVGFAKNTDRYESGRPTYPEESINFIYSLINAGPHKRILDLGAGTGKFTKHLIETDAQLVAVEPVADMRKKFTEKVPNIQILEGSAESIPLPSKTIDAVIVAQAFHWFDGQAALEEIHRVLNERGFLILIWNKMDENYLWIRKLSEIISEMHTSEPTYKSGAWQQAFKESKLFSPLSHRNFLNLQEANKQIILDRVGSISYISKLQKSEYLKVMKAAESLIDSDFPKNNKGIIEMPYNTDVFWTKSLNN